MKIGSSQVFDCLEIAFDIKKILFVLIGAAAALIGGALLVWAGNLTGNVVASALLQLAAALYFYVVIVSVCAGTSSMAYKELTTGEKLSVKDALISARKNLPTLILSPVLWLAGAVAVLLAEYVIFLAGKLAAAQVILSLLALPIIFINAFVLLFLLFGCLFLFEVITVDGVSAIGSVTRLFSLTRKASLQILMYLIPVLIVGSFAGAVVSLIFLGANIITLALFGTASGLFYEMAAVEVPALSPMTQAAWAIFSFFVSVISGMILSGLFVFIKTSNIAIYMSVKERIK